MPSLLATHGIRAKCLRQGKIYVDLERINAATQDLMLFFLRRDKHQPNVQVESSGLPYICAVKILRYAQDDSLGQFKVTKGRSGG